MTHSHRIFILILLLAIAYLPTLQTIPNGSSQLMMIDVGETQIVLNTWGTLHPTGYPLYVMVGNALVSLLRAGGIDAATAPALVSMFWGFLALIVIYSLLAHLSQQPNLALAVTLLFGLTRFVWVHQVVAEIYSMALLLIALLYWIAFWPHLRHRITLLAFVGGVGLAHHRGIMFMVLPLVVTVWNEIWPMVKRKPWLMIGWLLAGLVGFLPYLYLPLRANATWAYGDPGTWYGFKHQFLGSEASYLGGWPESFEQFRANWERFTRLLVDEVSLVGFVVGAGGLSYGLVQTRYRRVVATVGASAILAYVFSTLLYYDILATLVLMITLALALGWVLAAQVILKRYSESYGRISLGIAFILAATFLYTHNIRWIHDKTHDETGLETIAIAEQVPPHSTLMLAWGPRHFAVGFAKDVEKNLPLMQLVDHNADIQTALRDGKILVTPSFTFYNQSLSWWQARIGQRVYLRAIGPYLVQIDIEPAYISTELPTPTEDLEVMPIDANIQCQGGFISLYVQWLALEKPTRNLSVFVHVLDGRGQLIGQADQASPIYGWRPMTDWEKQEVVQDVYPLPTQGEAVRFGLYEQVGAGQFVNYYTSTISTQCP
ncbi:MAG: DUF2723 domain-containing protein [Anaerolineales bacterium]|nr:DUF2723 domain-containing protein [Anaerolineales bacterium]